MIQTTTDMETTGDIKPKERAGDLKSMGDLPIAFSLLMLYWCFLYGYFNSAFIFMHPLYSPFPQARTWDFPTWLLTCLKKILPVFYTQLHFPCTPTVIPDKNCLLLQGPFCDGRGKRETGKRYVPEQLQNASTGLTADLLALLNSSPWFKSREAQLRYLRPSGIRTAFRQFLFSSICLPTE